MKTQINPGRFIYLMLTLAAQVRYAANVPIHSRERLVTRLPVFRFIAFSMRRQQAEEAALGCRVFRFNSSDQCTPSSFVGAIE